MVQAWTVALAAALALLCHAGASDPAATGVVVHVVPVAGMDGWYLPQQTEKAREQFDVILAVLGRSEATAVVNEVAPLSDWWTRATAEARAAFKRLVTKGRIEIVGGGYVAHDDRFISQRDAFDQMALGHEWLQGNLGVLSTVAWHPAAHGASFATAQAATMMACEALFLTGLPEPSLAYLRGRRELSFLWGNEGANVLTHAAPTVTLPASQGDTSGTRSEKMVDATVDELVAAARLQHEGSRASHIFLPVVTPGDGALTERNFELLSSVLTAANRRGGSLSFRYSTPTAYLSALRSANVSFPLLRERDFLDNPLGDAFSHVLPLHRTIRATSTLLHAAEVALALAAVDGRSMQSASLPMLVQLRDAQATLATATHMHAIHSTERCEHTRELLAAQLHEAAAIATRVTAAAAWDTLRREPDDVDLPPLTLDEDKPISLPPDPSRAVPVVVFNALGFARAEVVCVGVAMPDSGSDEAWDNAARDPSGAVLNAVVHDADGRAVQVQITGVLHTAHHLSPRLGARGLGTHGHDALTREVCFRAHVPAMGYRVYFLSRATEPFDERVAGSTTYSDAPGAAALSSDRAAVRFDARAWQPASLEVHGLARPLQFIQQLVSFRPPEQLTWGLSGGGWFLASMVAGLCGGQLGGALIAAQLHVNQGTCLVVSRNAARDRRVKLAVAWLVGLVIGTLATRYSGPGAGVGLQFGLVVGVWVGFFAGSQIGVAAVLGLIIGLWLSILPGGGGGGGAWHDAQTVSAALGSPWARVEAGALFAQVHATLSPSIQQAWRVYHSPYGAGEGGAGGSGLTGQDSSAVELMVAAKPQPHGNLVLRLDSDLRLTGLVKRLRTDVGGEALLVERVRHAGARGPAGYAAVVSTVAVREGDLDKPHALAANDTQLTLITDTPCAASANAHGGIEILLDQRRTAGSSTDGLPQVAGLAQTPTVTDDFEETHVWVHVESVREAEERWPRRSQTIQHPLRVLTAAPAAPDRPWTLEDWQSAWYVQYDGLTEDVPAHIAVALKLKEVLNGEAEISVQLTHLGGWRPHREPNPLYTRSLFAHAEPKALYRCLPHGVCPERSVKPWPAVPSDGGPCDEACEVAGKDELKPYATYAFDTRWVSDKQLAG